jgi:hypothetical protein
MSYVILQRLEDLGDLLDRLYFILHIVSSKKWDAHAFV